MESGAPASDSSECSSECEAKRSDRRKRSRAASHRIASQLSSRLDCVCVSPAEIRYSFLVSFSLKTNSTFCCENVEYCTLSRLYCTVVQCAPVSSLHCPVLTRESLHSTRRLFCSALFCAPIRRLTLREAASRRPQTSAIRCARAAQTQAACELREAFCRSSTDETGRSRAELSDERLRRSPQLSSSHLRSANGATRRVAR